MQCMALQNLKDTKGLQRKFSLISVTISNHLEFSFFDQSGLYFSIKYEVGTQLYFLSDGYPVILLAAKVCFADLRLSFGIFMIMFAFSPSYLNLRVSLHVKRLYCFLKIELC